MTAWSQSLRQPATSSALCIDGAAHGAGGARDRRGQSLPPSPPRGAATRPWQAMSTPNCAAADSASLALRCTACDRSAGTQSASYAPGFARAAHVLVALAPARRKLLQC